LQEEPLSLAWYIVLQRQIPGFDHRVNGKFLARAGKVVETLAKKSGVVPLMAFFSAAPDELTGVVEDQSMNVEDTPVKLPPGEWFSAEEGLKTVSALKQAVTKQDIEGASQILHDLTEFENVLKIAKANQIGWHLAIDF
jgi:hypothetical protein